MDGTPHRWSLEVDQQQGEGAHPLQEVFGLGVGQRFQLVVGDDVVSREALVARARKLEGAGGVAGQERVEPRRPARGVAGHLETFEHLHEPADRGREALVDALIVMPDRRVVEVAGEGAEDPRVVESREWVAKALAHPLVGPGIGRVGFPFARVEGERGRR